MSIEMKTPKTLSELVDAAWNYVEQIRLANTIGNKAHVEKCVSEASRLLSLAMEKLEDES